MRKKFGKLFHKKLYKKKSRMSYKYIKKKISVKLNNKILLYPIYKKLKRKRLKRSDKHFSFLLLKNQKKYMSLYREYFSKILFLFFLLIEQEALKKISIFKKRCTIVSKKELFMVFIYRLIKKNYKFFIKLKKLVKKHFFNIIKKTKKKFEIFSYYISNKNLKCLSANIIKKRNKDLKQLEKEKKRKFCGHAINLILALVKKFVFKSRVTSSSSKIFLLNNHKKNNFYLLENFILKKIKKKKSFVPKKEEKSAPKINYDFKSKRLSTTILTKKKVYIFLSFLPKIIIKSKSFFLMKKLLLKNYTLTKKIYVNIKNLNDIFSFFFFKLYKYITTLSKNFGALNCLSILNKNYEKLFEFLSIYSFNVRFCSEISWKLKLKKIFTLPVFFSETCVANNALKKFNYSFKSPKELYCFVKEKVAEYKWKQGLPRLIAVLNSRRRFRRVKKRIRKKLSSGLKKKKIIFKSMKMLKELSMIKRVPKIFHHRKKKIKIKKALKYRQIFNCTKTYVNKTRKKIQNTKKGWRMKTRYKLISNKSLKLLRYNLIDPLDLKKNKRIFFPIPFYKLLPYIVSLRSTKIKRRHKANKRLRKKKNQIIKNIKLKIKKPIFFKKTLNYTSIKKRKKKKEKKTYKLQKFIWKNNEKREIKRDNLKKYNNNNLLPLKKKNKNTFLDILYELKKNKKKDLKTKKKELYSLFFKKRVKNKNKLIKKNFSGSFFFCRGLKNKLKFFNSREKRTRNRINKLKRRIVKNLWKTYLYGKHGSLSRRRKIKRKLLKRIVKKACIKKKVKNVSKTTFKSSLLILMKKKLFRSYLSILKRKTNFLPNFLKVLVEKKKQKTRSFIFWQICRLKNKKRKLKDLSLKQFLYKENILYFNYFLDFSRTSYNHLFYNLHKNFFSSIEIKFYKKFIYKKFMNFFIKYDNMRETTLSFFHKFYCFRRFLFTFYRKSYKKDRHRVHFKPYRFKKKHKALKKQEDKISILSKNIKNKDKLIFSSFLIHTKNLPKLALKKRKEKVEKRIKKNFNRILVQLLDEEKCIDFLYSNYFNVRQYSYEEKRKKHLIKPKKIKHMKFKRLHTFFSKEQKPKMDILNNFKYINTLKTSFFMPQKWKKSYVSDSFWNNNIFNKNFYNDKKIFSNKSKLFFVRKKKHFYPNQESASFKKYFSERKVLKKRKQRNFRYILKKFLIFFFKSFKDKIALKNILLKNEKFEYRFYYDTLIAFVKKSILLQKYKLFYKKKTSYKSLNLTSKVIIKTLGCIKVFSKMIKNGKKHIEFFRFKSKNDSLVKDEKGLIRRVKNTLVPNFLENRKKHYTYRNFYEKMKKNVFKNYLSIFLRFKFKKILLRKKKFFKNLKKKILLPRKLKLLRKIKKKRNILQRLSEKEYYFNIKILIKKYLFHKNHVRYFEKNFVKTYKKKKFLFYRQYRNKKKLCNKNIYIYKKKQDIRNKRKHEGISRYKRPYQKNYKRRVINFSKNNKTNLYHKTLEDKHKNKTNYNQPMIKNYKNNLENRYNTNTRQKNIIKNKNNNKPVSFFKYTNDYDYTTTNRNQNNLKKKNTTSIKRQNLIKEKSNYKPTNFFGQRNNYNYKNNYQYQSDFQFRPTNRNRSNYNYLKAKNYKDRNNQKYENMVKNENSYKFTNFFEYTNNYEFVDSNDYKDNYYYTSVARNKTKKKSTQLARVKNTKRQAYTKKTIVKKDRNNKNKGEKNSRYRSDYTNRNKLKHGIVKRTKGKIKIKKSTILKKFKRYIQHRKSVRTFARIVFFFLKKKRTILIDLISKKKACIKKNKQIFKKLNRLLYRNKFAKYLDLYYSLNVKHFDAVKNYTIALQNCLTPTFLIIKSLNNKYYINEYITLYMYRVNILNYLLKQTQYLKNVKTFKFNKNFLKHIKFFRTKSFFFFGNIKLL